MSNVNREKNYKTWQSSNTVTELKNVSGGLLPEKAESWQVLD